jgi:hypothetical protein
MGISIHFMAKSLELIRAKIAELAGTEDINAAGCKTETHADGKGGLTGAPDH